MSEHNHQEGIKHSEAGIVSNGTKRLKMLKGKNANSKNHVDGWSTKLNEEIHPQAAEMLIRLAHWPLRKNHPRAVPYSVSTTVKEACVHNADSTVLQAMQDLITGGYKAAPVVDADDNETFIGWFSLTDVVRLALEGQKSNSEHFWKNTLRTTYVSDVVKSQGSQDLAGTLSPHIDEHWSLLSIMEMMARLHVNHFAVCNDNGRVQSVITDSMVASLADQWTTDAEQAFNTLTVEQMMQNSLPKCMITVGKHTKTGKAFQQMIDNNIDTVGVIDKDLDGRLVDIINLRDVRGLEGDNVLLKALDFCVADYKALCRERFERQTPQIPITVTPTDTMRTVIELMSDGNLHVLPVIDKVTGKPLSCINQTDLIRHWLWLMGFDPVALP